MHVPCKHKTGNPNFLFLHPDLLLTCLYRMKTSSEWVGTLLKDKILLHNKTQLHVTEESGCDRKVSVAKLFLLLKLLFLHFELFLLYSTTRHTNCFQIRPLLCKSLPTWSIFLKQNSSMRLPYLTRDPIKHSKHLCCTACQSLERGCILSVWSVTLSYSCSILPSQVSKITQSNAQKHHSLSCTMLTKD